MLVKKNIMIMFGQLSSVDNIFNGCYSIISLDLKDLNVFSFENAKNMFYGCDNLKSLVDRSLLMLNL